MWSERDAAGLAWLLASPEPAVRALARRDLLGLDAGETDDDIRSGPWVAALLAGQRSDGGFGVHAYGKWTGAHWRLVSLVELGIPRGDRSALTAADPVLRWLSGASHRANVPVVKGRARRCASQEGNALAVCARIGAIDDPRVADLARLLVGWQWPDGGWNCDRRPGASHSSVNETLPAIWGLHEWARATGDEAALRAADRGAEFLLAHWVIYSHRSDDTLHPRVVEIHFPPYWHYDVLQALLVLSRMGRLRDLRAADALDLIESRQRDDGCWSVDAPWWHRRPSGTGREVVDWGRRGPNAMATLNAFRVLVSAGRRQPPRR